MCYSLLVGGEGFVGLGFGLFCSARTGLRKDLICLSCLRLRMHLKIGPTTFFLLLFYLVAFADGISDSKGNILDRRSRSVVRTLCNMYS